MDHIAVIHFVEAFKYKMCSQLFLKMYTILNYEYNVKIKI
jgi:hypothetical protein